MHNSLVHHSIDISSALLLVDGPEDDVHVLQTTTLGLLDEEEHPYTHSEAKATKHDESLPADVRYSVWCDLRNDEVKQPLSSSTHTHTIGSQTCREDLGEVHPWNWTP